MSGQTETEVAYPASWWESRTREQLQDFVRAGFVSGDTYYGAQREIERRARESTQLVEQAVDDKVRRRVERGNHVALIAALVCLFASVLAVASLLIAR